MKISGNLRAYYVGSIVCIAGFLFGYDSGIIGSVLTLSSFQNHFGFTSGQKTHVSSLCVSLQQLGAFLGSIFIIPVARKYGRKDSIFGGSLVFCIGATLQTVPSASLPCFYVGRVIAGLGLGAMTSAVPTYNAEMAPKELRGRIGSFFQMAFTLGIFTSYWISYGVKVSMPATDRQWQVPVGLQILFSALLGLGMLTVKESARWLAKKDRVEESWESLKWIRASDGPEVAAEVSEINLAIRAETAETEGLTVGEIFEWRNLRNIVAGFTLFLAQQATGATAFAYYSPQYFTLLVGDNQNRSLLLSGIFGAVKVVACFFFVWLAADRYSRKINLTVGAVAMAITQFITAGILKNHPTSSDAAADVPGSSMATVAMIYLFVIIYNFSWGPLPWPYVNELFSTRYREIGVSVAVASQWLWNFVFTIATPYMIDDMGWGTFLLWGIFDIVIGAGTWFFARETRGKSLEESGQPELYTHDGDAKIIDDAGRASTSGYDPAAANKTGGQVNERAT